MYSGSANTDEIVFDLNVVHRHYKKTVLIVWDGLRVAPIGGTSFSFAASQMV